MAKRTKLAEPSVVTASPDEPQHEAPAKHAGGRPSKYDPAFCERIVEMGLQGYSKAEMAADLGVIRETLDNWAEAHPEFFDALTRAHMLSLAWWERQGRTGLVLQGFNAALYAKCMAGRFPREPYSNRIEHSGPNGEAITIREQRAIAVDRLRDFSPESRQMLREMLTDAEAQLNQADAIDAAYEVRDDG